MYFMLALICPGDLKYMYKENKSNSSLDMMSLCPAFNVQGTQDWVIN